MAQSALTVTTPNPTPPTNYSFVGATPPSAVPNYTKLTYLNYPRDFVTNPPPYFDDGISGAGSTINEPAAGPASRVVFAANKAALASGTGATSGGTEGTYPGTGTYGDRGGSGTVSAFGAVPASTSVAHEGAGTETLVTAPGSRAECPTQSVSCLGSFTGVANPPNQQHASSLSPVSQTFTNITPGSSVSGVGTTTLGAVGTGFTSQSVIVVNGVPQVTTFVSSTSINAASVTKKTSAGSWPVTVVTAGTTSMGPITWTFT
jgi:hypothetical protein